jgi:dipeptidyl aminopeptidase/acylaminoacyl peptidase
MACTGAHCVAGKYRNWDSRIVQDIIDATRYVPAYNADQIRAGVLLIHGLQGNRAPLEHAEKLKGALAKAGQSPEWILEPREGHGFYTQRKSRKSRVDRLRCRDVVRGSAGSVSQVKRQRE